VTRRAPSGVGHAADALGWSLNSTIPGQLMQPAYSASWLTTPKDLASPIRPAVSAQASQEAASSSAAPTSAQREALTTPRTPKW
jgi:hypothetical protein